MVKVKLIIPTRVEGKEGMLRRASRDKLSGIQDEGLEDVALLPTEPEQLEKGAVSSGRKVRFAPKKTSIYYPNTLSDEDYKTLCWYSHAEIEAFFQEMAQTMRDIWARERESKSPFYWTKALVHIHKAFAAPLPSQRSLLSLMEGRFEIEDAFVGLEVRAIPALNREFQSERQALLLKVRYWQEQGSPKVSAEQLADLILEASVQNSQASVRYANYIAEYHARRLVQEQVLEEQEQEQESYQEEDKWSPSWPSMSTTLIEDAFCHRHC